MRGTSVAVCLLGMAAIVVAEEVSPLTDLEDMLASSSTTASEQKLGGGLFNTDKDVHAASQISKGQSVSKKTVQRTDDTKAKARDKVATVANKPKAVRTKPSLLKREA